jgi:hypothetical protein
MNKLIAVLAAVLLAGCGEMRWAKPDGDASALARDETNCRAAARESVQRQYGSPVPAYGRSDPRFGPDTGQPSPADRQLLESQAVDRCMRAKGYALVPAGK